MNHLFPQLTEVSVRLGRASGRLAVWVIAGVVTMACSGCSAVYDRNMQNGRVACLQIDDAQRRSDCLRYYSMSYERYEDEVRKARSGGAKDADSGQRKP